MASTFVAMRAVRNMQVRTALAKQTVMAKRGKETTVGQPLPADSKKTGSVDKLGSIHKPEVRAGSGSKYELQVALSRYAKDQARRNTDAALSRKRKEARADKKPAGGGAAVCSMTPLEQILSELPRYRESTEASKAKAVPCTTGEPAGKTTDSARVHRRRRKGPARRRRKQAPAAPTGPDGGDSKPPRPHAPTAPGSRRMRRAVGRPAAPSQKTAPSAEAGTVRRRRGALPPQIKIPAGRCVQPVPWRA